MTAPRCRARPAHDALASPPPYDEAAEQAVLGAMFLDRKAIVRVVEELRPEDFYRDAHRAIFSEILALVERGEPVDSITVSNRLSAAGELDDVGGVAFVASLPNAAPTTSNVDSYADIVLEKSMLRALINVGAHIAMLGTEGMHDVAAQIDQAEKLISEIASRCHGNARASSRFRTAQELTCDASDETAWRVPPYLADGAITELDGKIKVAGKTTLALAMTRSILEGIPFLGRPTKQSSVVYLTEQPTMSFNAALRRAGLQDRADLHILRFADVMSEPWPEVALDAIHTCKYHGARALVIDTLGRFASIPEDLENAAGAAQEAMAPLLRAATSGIAVLVLRHDRKSGGEVGESARGSTAFGGAADIILSIRRSSDSENTDPNLRELHALSRFDDTPPLVIVRLGTNFTYNLIGTAAEVQENQAAARLLSAVPRNEGDAMKTEELLKAAGIKRTLGHEIVERLYREGQVARLGAGKRGDPFRYWVSSIDLSVEEERVRMKPTSGGFVRAHNPYRADE